MVTLKSFDPGNCRLIVCYLLEELGTKPSPLTVLKPLALKEREKLPDSVRQWKAELSSLELPEEKNKNTDGTAGICCPTAIFRPCTGGGEKNDTTDTFGKNCNRSGTDSENSFPHSIFVADIGQIS